MKRWKVETKEKGKWTFAGMFTERFVPQLVNAAINQAKRGKQMYKTLRVEEVKHGNTPVL